MKIPAVAESAFTASEFADAHAAAAVRALIMFEWHRIRAK
jgi:hypothetical protein